MARGRRGRRSRSKQRSKGAGSRSASAGKSKGGSRSSAGSKSGGNRSGSGSKSRSTSRSRSTTKKKSAPTSRRTQQRTNQRGVGTNKAAAAGVKNTVKKAVSAVKNTVGRITRPPAAVASNRRNTVTDTRNQTFNNRLKQIQAQYPGASPNSAIFGMSDAQLNQPGGPFNQTGPGGPESEANYTSYQPGSFYNQSDTNMNLTNALRSTRNLITSPARALGINTGLTNKLIPKSNEAIQDARDQRSQFHVGNKPRPTLRRRGGSGGASRIEQQAAAQQMQPEIAPTIGTPPAEEYIESAAPQGDLTRIQSQAYNTQLTSSLAGMFGGQGSVGYTPQGSPELSPTLRAGTSRGRRRVRMFGARRRRGGTGDQFSRAGDRIAKLTNINI